MAQKISRDHFKKKWPKTAAMGPEENAILAILKDYEHAIRSAMPMDMIIHLDGLDVGINNARSKWMKEKIKPMKTAALKVLDELHAESLTKLSGLRKKERNFCVVWKGDLAKEVIKQVGQIKTLNDMTMYLALPEIVVDELKASKIHDRVVRELDAAITDAAKTIGAQVEKILKQNAGGNVQIVIDTMIRDEAARLQDRFDTVAADALHQATKNKRIRTKYKLQKGKAIGKSAAGVGLSAAAIGIPGTQPVAIVMFIREVGAMVNEVLGLLLTAEKQRAWLLANLQELQRRTIAARSGQKKGAFLSEGTAQTINSLLGGDYLPTVKKVLKMGDDYRGQVALVDKHAIKIAKKMAESDAKLKMAQGDTAKTRKKVSDLKAKLLVLEKRARFEFVQSVILNKKLKKIDKDFADIKQALVYIDSAINTLLALAGTADAIVVGKAAHSITIAALSQAKGDLL